MAFRTGHKHAAIPSTMPPPSSISVEAQQTTYLPPQTNTTFPHGQSPHHSKMKSWGDDDEDGEGGTTAPVVEKKSGGGAKAAPKPVEVGKLVFRRRWCAKLGFFHPQYHACQFLCTLKCTYSGFFVKPKRPVLIFGSRGIYTTRHRRTILTGV